MCASAWNCAPEIFMENDVGQALKNATSGQRLIISYGPQPTKETRRRAVFSQRLVQVITFGKNLNKPYRPGHPIVLVSASISRDFSDASRAPADRPKHRNTSFRCSSRPAKIDPALSRLSSRERNLAFRFCRDRGGPGAVQARKSNVVCRNSNNCVESMGADTWRSR